MKRRDFLKASAATIAMVHTGFTAGRKLKKAVKYGMVGIQGTVLDKFKLVKSLGFDGIELDSPSPLGADEVLKARDSTKLPIHGVVDSVHWRKTLGDASQKVRDEGRAALETALRDAKRYGGDTVLLVPGVVNKKMPYDRVYERSQAVIRKVLPLARDLKIRIAIENVWNNFLLSPLEAARYIDEFKSEWIGWYFDVGNIVRYGWPEQWVRVLSHRIFKLDIKDWSRKQGFGARIGEGGVDWKAVMKELDAIGYGGWATAEVRGGGADRLKEIAERMEKVFHA